MIWFLKNEVPNEFWLHLEYPINGKQLSGIFRFLPIGIIGIMLLINAVVVYFYTRKI
jgi:hypothetical protein